MPKRLKFVVEQWVLFMVWRQTWQVRRFEIFASASHFRVESNWDVRFELNLEALQVPTSNTYCDLATQPAQSHFRHTKNRQHNSSGFV